MSGNDGLPGTRDPGRRKARDNARQRKIAAKGSDKAARRLVPKRKAEGKRKVRRLDKQALARDPVVADAVLAAQGRRRFRAWGSHNAAERRAERKAERAFLQDRPSDASKGRRRARVFRMSRFAAKHHGVGA